jgi:hypothetical protein
MAVKRVDYDRHSTEFRREASQRAALCRVCVHDVRAEATKLRRKPGERLEVLMGMNRTTEPWDPRGDNALTSDDVEHLGFAGRYVTGEQA